MFVIFHSLFKLRVRSQGESWQDLWHKQRQFPIPSNHAWLFKCRTTLLKITTLLSINLCYSFCATQRVHFPVKMCISFIHCREWKSFWRDFSGPLSALSEPMFLCCCTPPHTPPPLMTDFGPKTSWNLSHVVRKNIHTPRTQQHSGCSNWIRFVVSDLGIRFDLSNVSFNFFGNCFDKTS